MRLFAVGSRGAIQLVHRALLQRTPEITVGTGTTGQDGELAAAGRLGAGPGARERTWLHAETGRLFDIFLS